MTKVFIIRLGGPYPRLERLASRLPILGPLVSGLARDSNARRNPRSREYMERAAADAFPEFDGRAMVMLEDRSAAMRDWSACDEIVLLWPERPPPAVCAGSGTVDAVQGPPIPPEDARRRDRVHAGVRAADAMSLAVGHRPRAGLKG